MRSTFKSHLDDHARVFQHPGDRDKVLYSPVFDEAGNLELKPSGKEDLYAFIQSHSESVDIHVILDRFARGDVSALSKVQGTYGDFTTLPKTYAEMLNVVIQGENQFMALPVEIRAKFDHDFRKWIASMDNMENWLSLMGIQAEVPAEPSPEPVVKPEVVEKLEKEVAPTV